MMLINTLHNWSGSDNQNLRVWQVGQELVQVSQDRNNWIDPIILVGEERSDRKQHLVVGKWANLQRDDLGLERLPIVLVRGKGKRKNLIILKRPWNWRKD